VLEQPLIETGGERPASDADAAARKAFSTSVLVSAVRCLITYVLLPIVAPLVQLTSNTGLTAVGVAVTVVAIVFNVLSIRRFLATGHRWRYLVVTINVAMIAMLTFMMVTDLRQLLS
jgi:hypothetical protein